MNEILQRLGLQEYNSGAWTDTPFDTSNGDVLLVIIRRMVLYWACAYGQQDLGDGDQHRKKICRGVCFHSQTR